MKNMLEDFAKLNLGPSRISEDIIGEAYIYLIERFASDAGKKAGEFYTPRQVSRILARLAAPKAGDRISDPACGSVSANAPSFSPLTKEGSHRRFCSSVPKSNKARMPML